MTEHETAHDLYLRNIRDAERLHTLALAQLDDPQLVPWKRRFWMHELHMAAKIKRDFEALLQADAA